MSLAGARLTKRRQFDIADRVMFWIYTYRYLTGTQIIYEKFKLTCNAGVPHPPESKASRRARSLVEFLKIALHTSWQETVSATPQQWTSKQKNHKLYVVLSLVSKFFITYIFSGRLGWTRPRPPEQPEACSAEPSCLFGGGTVRKRNHFDKFLILIQNRKEWVSEVFNENGNAYVLQQKYENTEKPKPCLKSRHCRRSSLS